VSRPASTPRLSAIDPAELGREAQARAEEYLHSLALRLGLDVRIVGDRIPQLELAVQDLARYARGDGPLDAPVSEYLQSVYEALWIRPIDGAAYRTPELDEALGGELDELADDLMGRLCLVSVAALGREVLEQGHALTVAQLAALASYSPHHVRLLAREGRLKLSDRGGELRCSAAEARRLLEGARKP
jgi:hypothetical protein